MLSLEALELAVIALRRSSLPNAMEAREVVQSIIEQKGCEAMAPEENCDKLTDLIDLAVFG